MAASPSSKPDWSVAEHIIINFSGNRLTFTLPGNLSGEYENKIEPNVNIYNKDLQGEWKRFSAADLWWTYQGKSFFVITEVFGSLTLKIAAFSPGHRESDFYNAQALQNGVTQLYKAAYPSSPERAPTDFKMVEINNVQWMKYASIDERGLNNGVKYVAAINESHFVELSFGVIESKERTESDWYSLVQADIQKIAKSAMLEQ